MLFVVASDETTEVVDGEGDIGSGTDGKIKKFANGFSVREMSTFRWSTIKLRKLKTMLHWSTSRIAFGHAITVKDFKNES